MKDQLDVTCYFISLICRLQPAKRTPPKSARTKSSNTQRTENKTTDVVYQQHSRKLLMMDILMSETCWAHKKWNKITSDIKLVFHSSSITMMHGPINIRNTNVDNIAPNIIENTLLPSTRATPLKLYKETITVHIHVLQAERRRFNVKSGGTYANYSV